MYQAPKARRRELWSTHYVSVLYIKRRTITRGEHNIHDPRSTRDRPETDPRPTRDRPEIDPRLTRDRPSHRVSTLRGSRSTRDRPETGTSDQPNTLFPKAPRKRAEKIRANNRDRHHRGLRAHARLQRRDHSCADQPQGRIRCGQEGPRNSLE